MSAPTAPGATATATSGGLPGAAGGAGVAGGPGDADARTTTRGPTAAGPSGAPGARPAVPGSGARPGRRPTRAAVVDAAVLTAAVALALLPLVPVFGATAVVAPAVGGLLLGGGLSLVAGLRRWGVLSTAAVLLVTYLLAGGALAAPTTTTAGVVPTQESVRLLLTGVVTVWKEVLTLDPSLGRSGGVLVAPYLLATVGAAVAVGAAVRTPRRRGAWAAVVPLLVLLVAVLLGTKEAVAPGPVGAVLAVLLLVWTAWRVRTLSPRRVTATVTMLAVVAAAGGAGGVLVAEDRPRLVLRDELVPPFDPRDHPSPLSAFRKFHKDWRDTDLLRVSGLPEGAAVRIATMDAFDGVVWDVAGSEATDGSGRFRRVGETIGTSVRGEEAVVELETLAWPFVWLPTVGWATEVDFAGEQAPELAADLRYNDETGTAVLVDGVPAGTRWTADVVVPEQPDDDTVGAAGEADVTLPEPENVPDAVPLFAGEVAGTATTPVLIARSLEEGLAERGYFSHGIVSAGDAESLSGHGSDRVTTLLTGDLMVGDHEQYASAMALLAREMGLPARVVLGFRADDEGDGRDATDGDAGDGGSEGGDGDGDGGDGAGEGGAGADAGGVVTFTGDDVEAWVEVAFEGHGWVAFDPTPPESRTPSDETPEDQSDPQPQVVQPPPPPRDPVTPPDEDIEQARTQDTEDQLEAAFDWRRAALVAAATTLPVLLLMTPFLLVLGAKRRRRRRRRGAERPVDRVVGGWDELVDEATDLHRPVPRAATRREAAVHLARAFAVQDAGGTEPSAEERGRRAARVGAPVARLAATADGVVFGGGVPTPEQVEQYWADVATAVAVLRGSVGRRQRWAARVSLRSLRARRSERRGRRGGRRGGRGTADVGRVREPVVVGAAGGPGAAPVQGGGRAARRRAGRPGTDGP